MSERNQMSPRRFLAKSMRRLREAKGMTREELAKVIYVSESLVRSWERGTRVPQPDHLKKFEETFGTQGILSDLREDLINSAAPLEWMAEWRQVESDATSLWWLEMIVIPGLLQTEDYARAVLGAAYYLADAQDMVADRLARQKILEKDSPPTFVALIAESVLRNNIGGAKVMRDQLLHLVELAERDNIIIQVIPASATVCAGFTGPFIVASFDGGNEIAYLDDAISGSVIEEAEDVARLRRMFDIFRAEAMSKSESIKFIGKLAEKWNE